MTRAHDKAVLDRLLAGPGMAGHVFEGEVLRRDGQGQPLDVPQWYVLLHSNRGVIRPDRFAGPARRRRKTYWLHAVGASKGQADKVAELGIQQLLNWTPDLPGWQCERFTHEASQPVQKDDTTKPALYFGVDQFDFYTTPLQ
jgi:hypothetical protein